MSLDDLARAGRERAEREARETAEARATSQRRADQHRSRRAVRAERLLTIRCLRSTTAWTYPMVASAGLLIASSLGLSVSLMMPLEFTPMLQTFVRVSLGGPLALLVVTGAWVFFVRHADIAFRAARPYQVTKYGETLDWRRSYPATDFEIHFEASTPPAELLANALASIEESTTLESIDAGVAKCRVEGKGSKFDGHRRWLTRWFRPACEGVFDVLHREHPIHAIRFPGL